MMLFGDLKTGGNLVITAEDGEIKLTKKIKAPKVPQVENETQTEDSNKENQEII